MTLGTDNMRHHGRVIPHTAAKMENSAARLEFERIDSGCDSRRTAIEKLAVGIDRDRDVVVNVARIGVRRST
jgi:hypothetical protein